MEPQEVDQAAIQRYESDTPSGALAIRSLDDISRISRIFVQSGMFKGGKGLNAEMQLYQAGVKIIAGVEFGIQPFAAMRGINIINGNAEMSANLMAAKVKSHPKYEYRVKQWDQDGCVLTFYEIPHPGAKRDEWDELGESSFNKADAVQARLTGDNWQKFARNMYFARAMSNGVRIYCPDIFYGAPVYVEGEISAEVSVTTNTDEVKLVDPVTDSAAPQDAPTGRSPEAPETEEVPESSSEPQEAEVVKGDEPELSAEDAEAAERRAAEEAAAKHLDECREHILKLMRGQGITTVARQKAYINKVLEKGKIESQDDADQVIAALEEQRKEEDDEDQS